MSQRKLFRGGATFDLEPLGGTFARFFQIGGPSGPGFDAVGTALEATTAQGALTPLRAGEPVGAHDLVTLNHLAGSVASTQPPYAHAAPLASGASYTMKATDGVLYVAAGAKVTLPVTPVVGLEYLVKVVSGSAETVPAQVLAGSTYSVEDPGGAAAYALVSGATYATMKVSAACNGWTFDGTTMNLTR